MGEFNAQGLANTVWAFTTADQSDDLLFALLVRAVEHHRQGEYNPQAFPMADCLHDVLLAALARAVEHRLGEFNTQNLANTAWAFAIAGEQAPGLLDPISVLDAIESQSGWGATPWEVQYQMLIHSLARTGQIKAGFALLARLESNGLLSDADEHCYPMFHMLLETCRAIGDSHGISPVQTSVERLGPIPATPVATVRANNGCRERHGMSRSTMRHSDELRIQRGIRHRIPHSSKHPTVNPDIPTDPAASAAPPDVAPTQGSRTKALVRTGRIFGRCVWSCADRCLHTLAASTAMSSFAE